MGVGRTIWSGSPSHLEEAKRRLLLFMTDLVYLAPCLLSLSPTRKCRLRFPVPLPVPGILPAAAEPPAGCQLELLWTPAQDSGPGSSLV